jgi:hypothetical protein
MKNLTQESKEGKKWVSFFCLNTRIGSESGSHFASKRKKYFNETGAPLTKLSLVGNNLIIPGQGEFGNLIPAWDAKIANLFLQYSMVLVHMGNTVLLQKKISGSKKIVTAFRQVFSAIRNSTRRYVLRLTSRISTAVTRSLKGHQREIG